MNELLKLSLKAINAAENDFETRDRPARKRLEVAKHSMAYQRKHWRGDREDTRILWLRMWVGINEVREIKLIFKITGIGKKLCSEKEWIIISRLENVFKKVIILKIA